jgi:hypothetical protein
VGCDAATSSRDAGGFFESKAAAATRCDSGPGGLCGRKISEDRKVERREVASLDLRRTSTVNDGMLRFNSCP